MINDIVSVPVGDGDAVTVIVNEALTPATHGDVVLAPVFGGTAHSMFPFAYALARNGFRVLRVDFRDHVGLSRGEIVDTRMSTQVEDLLAVLGTAPDAILAAVSLSARPAMRALGSAGAVRGAVLVTPVVDVRSTLVEVIGTDYSVVADDDLPPTVDVLDYAIDSRFMVECRRAGFLTPESAIDDLTASGVPLSFVAGDADPWVDFATVERVADACRAAGGDVSLTAIPAASHRLNRNPAVATRYIEAMTRECLRIAKVDEDVVVPTFDEVLRASSASRAAARKVPVGQPS